mgnify:FL=1
MSDDFEAVESEDFDLDMGDEDADDTVDEVYEEDDEGTDDDPWGWASDLDPSKVQKTWTQYTQTREELVAEKKATAQLKNELQPFIKLREEIVSDPGLVQVIEEYLQNSRPVDREVASMKQELGSMKAQMMTEVEIEKLNTWVDKNGYPKVEKEDILRYAVENGIPNLQTAYKDKFFDELREQRAKEVTDGIKRSKGAASIPRKGKVAAKKQGSYDVGELRKMSDDDFLKNYDEILKSYSQ